MVDEAISAHADHPRRDGNFDGRIRRNERIGEHNLALRAVRGGQIRKHHRPGDGGAEGDVGRIGVERLVIEPRDDKRVRWRVKLLPAGVETRTRPVERPDVVERVARVGVNLRSRAILARVVAAEDVPCAVGNRHFRHRQVKVGGDIRRGRTERRATIEVDDDVAAQELVRLNGVRLRRAVGNVRQFGEVDLAVAADRAAATAAATRAAPARVVPVDFDHRARALSPRAIVAVVVVGALAGAAAAAAAGVSVFLVVAVAPDEGSAAAAAAAAAGPAAAADLRRRAAAAAAAAAAARSAEHVILRDAHAAAVVRRLSAALPAPGERSALGLDNDGIQHVERAHRLARAARASTCAAVAGEAVVIGIELRQKDGAVATGAARAARAADARAGPATADTTAPAIALERTMAVMPRVPHARIGAVYVTNPVLLRIARPVACLRRVASFRRVAAFRLDPSLTHENERGSRGDLKPRLSGNPVSAIRAVERERDAIWNVNRDRRILGNREPRRDRADGNRRAARHRDRPAARAAREGLGRVKVVDSLGERRAAAERREVGRGDESLRRSRQCATDAPTHRRKARI